MLKTESKKRVVRNGWSRIWEVRILIFIDVGGSRQPLEPVFRSWGIVMIFMARPVRKSTCFDNQNVASDTLFAVLLFLKFSLSVFLNWIIVILRARRLNFMYYFNSFLGALGLWENYWICVTVINFRGLTLPRRRLLARPECGCVLIMSLCRLRDLGLFWSSPFERFLYKSL